MRSPFDDLGKPKIQDPEGEEVTGAFSCQEEGCYFVVNTARYITEGTLVTWRCPDGHYSKAIMDLG